MPHCNDVIGESWNDKSEEYGKKEKSGCSPRRGPPGTNAFCGIGTFLFCFHIGTQYIRLTVGVAGISFFPSDRVELYWFSKALQERSARQGQIQGYSPPTLPVTTVIEAFGSITF